jgi:hypothetical protein
MRVQWNTTLFRLIDPLTGQLLREHLRQERGRHRIQDQDRPSRTPLGSQQLLARAEKTGRHIGPLCQALRRKYGQLAMRKILYRQHTERAGIESVSRFAFRYALLRAAPWCYGGAGCIN